MENRRQESWYHGLLGGRTTGFYPTHFGAGDVNVADPLERQRYRPDLGVVCFDVITMGANTHTGSRNNLLGPSPPVDLVILLCNKLRVTPQTPPCFTWPTDEDKVVMAENSLGFATALRRNKVPFDLYSYQKGGQSRGLGDKLSISRLHTRADDRVFWLKAQGFVNT